MKRLFLLLLLTTSLSMAFSQATWIWYPGDYEIWLGNQLQNRRVERGKLFPPFWKLDSHYVLVEFSTEVTLNQTEDIQLYTEGRYQVTLDGVFLKGDLHQLSLSPGKHRLSIKIFNQEKVPALYVQGKTLYSGSHWKVAYQDAAYYENGVKRNHVQAGCWHFDTPENRPSNFKLPTEHMEAISTENIQDGILVDFGKETFGFPSFEGLQGQGQLNIYYGESRQEALDTAYCELTDYVKIANTTTQLTLNDSRAFRFLYIVPATSESSLQIGKISMEYEYLPLNYRGSFRCNESNINTIWDVSAYTLQLTTREFFIDGIKRDRWVWSGDAAQSYLMNYYSFFDSPSVRRTMYLLRGKDPVINHLNTIMDYTLYWFISLYDYYLYTGDKDFIQEMYPRMKTLMQYVLDRRNKNGLLEGEAGDWVFIDWADAPMNNSGEVSFEQLLFCRSLESMALCADILKIGNDQSYYNQLAQQVKDKLFNTFWDIHQQRFIHNKINNVSDGSVTRYTNMFAILYDYLNDSQIASVRDSVLLNNRVMKITTPYMRFYELEALCKIGRHDYVLDEIRKYWGGMLQEGATTFWEKYQPELKGDQQLCMYGNRYGKSLCHAWGAGPIYLLGKYFLGVKPTAAGYTRFEIRPVLGTLDWMEGTVPTPNGDIKLYVNDSQVKVSFEQGEGYLYIRSMRTPKTSIGTVERDANDKKLYRILLNQPHQEYIIQYKAATF